MTVDNSLMHTANTMKVRVTVNGVASFNSNKYAPIESNEFTVKIRRPQIDSGTKISISGNEPGINHDIEGAYRFEFTKFTAVGGLGTINIYKLMSAVTSSGTE
jgi:hypothetical protein